jgi:hypothetical protein
MPSPSEYATDLEQATSETIAFTERCSPEDWAIVVPGDGWPVGVVVHHIAEGFDLVSRWIDSALAGAAIDDTADAIDANNLRHAQEFSGATVEETVELLRTNSAAAAAKLSRLDDTDMAKTAAFGPAGGQPFTVEQFCAAAAGHVRSHLARAQAVVS